ncbi:MAG: hypothetical protein GC199_10940 [Alphaproteobacteria bacterium]|nr:hypothetical protein [Alphaproteobacteria bacterium]
MDEIDLMRFIGAFALVMGLLFGCAWAARRLGFTAMTLQAGTQRRLALVETRRLDARNTLALVRRDGVEHLLLIGPTGATLIEGGIAPAPDAAEAPANAAPVPTLVWPHARAPQIVRTEPLP